MSLCPIANKKRNDGPCCSVTSCPFWSSIEPEGCFHGQTIDADSLAKHKSLTVKQLCRNVDDIEEDVLQTLRLFKYAEYCTDAIPSKEDEWMWRHAKDVPPFNTPLFSFVTVNRYARMRQLSAFEGFKRTGVVIEESLEEFLDWNFRRHDISVLSMELFL